MGRYARTFDWFVIIPAILLLSFGLITLLSISLSFFYQQLAYVVVGIVLLYIFSRIEFSLYQYLDVLIYILSLFALLMSYLGPQVRGATRWLEIAGFRFQPSEIVKPFFLLCLASFMTKYPPTKPKYILMHLVIFLVPFFLVFHQPDLGSALVYFSMWLGLLLIAGIPLWIPIGTAFILGTAIPFLYNFLRDYQKMRIVTFLNPEHDPQGAGYNAIQSMISVGSGQLFGRGFGRGTQSLLQFLPERHTDFIFASFAEEFGFIGSMLLLFIFSFLLWRLLKKARFLNTQNFAYLYICGICIEILTHVFINIGMNIGMLPITGITLPFVSYGGSSLIAMCIGLGIYLSAISGSKKV